MPRLEPERPQHEAFIDYMTAADLMGVQPGILLRWLREGEFSGKRLRVKWHVALSEIAKELGTKLEEFEENLNSKR